MQTHKTRQSSCNRILTQYLFFRIQPLFFKTETLYLVKVETGFERDHIVGGNASDRPVCWVPGGVKCQGSLTGHEFDLSLMWFELPTHCCTGVSIESANAGKRISPSDQNFNVGIDRNY